MSAKSPTMKRRHRGGDYRGDWSRALLAVAVVAVLLCLSVANAVVQSTWSGVEDGILWEERPDGLVVAAIDPSAPAAAAGVVPGDVLLAVDGVPIEQRRELLLRLYAARVGATLDYTLLRADEARLLTVAVVPISAGSFPIYMALASVGLVGLLVGAAVRVRRPGHQATLHFFWLTVAFFGVFAFSYVGRFDLLDWFFFWADEVATLLVAPLFMHFALVFPERAPGWLRHRLGSRVLPIVYAPAVILGLMQAATVANTPSGAPFQQAVERIWNLEHLYLALCTLGGLALMVSALRRVRSVTSRRQLRWTVSGAVLGGLPFALGYALPYALGFDPALGLELTAVPLGLIPLAFASAIIRYRLRDVEVIVKRSVVYAVVVAAMVGIYLAFEWLATAVFLDGSDRNNTIIALLATAVVVLLAGPVTRTIQTMLDRLYYRDRFDYRRALVRFAQDLNADLDLERLSERLVQRVASTLAVDRMALLLGPGLAAGEGAEANGNGRVRESFDAPSLMRSDFLPIRWVGFDVPPPSLSRASSVGERMAGRHTVLLDDPAHRRQCAPRDVAFWRDQGLYYFVPCIAEEGVIAVLALGRKGSGEPLSSEDVSLLTAVAGQAATALENGRLYGQLHEKADELDRMRQFSENIIESLSDGLAVVDLEDRVVRWNAGLERMYGVPRLEAIGRRLDELFDPAFVDRLRSARRENPQSQGDVYRAPLVSRHAEPRRLLVHAELAPLLTPDGETGGTMLIVVDITERAQLEEQVQLSEKFASIGQLAAGVAHEVKTPLTGISSFTQTLLSGADPDDPRTRMLHKIERQTFRAAKIVNGLLHLARPGRSESAGPVPINTVINDVLGLVEHQLESGNVKVRRELADPSPVIQGVEFKLQQVFLNLCLNARDAMSSGGWLTVSTRVAGGNAVIEVADTGAGIAPEHLSRIYDPFYTTKPAGQGTGLGLSITYGVVREHEGTIECDSQAGQGTRFTLSLPLATTVTSRSRVAEAVLP
ncbi:MAG: PAS domain-containing protein [Acidobacteria bacterium]|nr:PAS domain-containing protein [Acidobacteriota bacterium]MYD70281.1 PAS domain-containing protein [Acidobacteriota bacterium]MYJ04701.1 PAS domain-containing protein [Acidobacteriota bacterium]